MNWWNVRFYSELVISIMCFSVAAWSFPQAFLASTSDQGYLHLEDGVRYTCPKCDTNQTTLDMLHFMSNDNGIKTFHCIGCGYIIGWQDGNDP